MTKKAPEPSVVWNEERHVFLLVGPDRYQHYIRELDGRRNMLGAEKLAEQKFYTLLEAKAWIIEHNPGPIEEIEVEAVKAYPTGESDTDNEILRGIL